jgi:predicted phosphodiesterase
MSRTPRPDRLTKVISLADIHYPYNIDLTSIEQFMRDWQPDIINYLGDMMDLEYMAKYNENHKVQMRGSLQLEYNAVHNMIKRHKRISGATRINYLEGNHEYRVRAWLEKHPMCEGLIDVPAGIRLDELGVDWHEENMMVKIGGLYYMHGVFCNTYHARTTLQRYVRHIIYGHAHDVQQMVEPRPYDILVPPQAKAIGCLCNKNPDWLRKKPNRWIHSFHVAIVDECSDIFWDYIILMKQGMFMVPGINKVYGAPRDRRKEIK